MHGYHFCKPHNLNMTCTSSLSKFLILFVYVYFFHLVIVQGVWGNENAGLAAALAGHPEPSQHTPTPRAHLNKKVDPLDKVTTQEQFMDIVKAKDNKLHFIKFYAPWCGHCQRLEPVWHELALKYNIKQKEKLVQITSVDCTSLKSICSAFSIQGYPTLLALWNGEVIDEFHQQRSMDALESFVERLIKPLIFDGHVIPLSENIYAMDTTKRGSSWLILLEDEKNFFDHDEVRTTAEHFRGTSTMVARLNCDTNEALCKQFKKVISLPAAVLLQGGSYIVSTAAKSAVSLKQFVSEGIPTLLGDDVSVKFPRPGVAAMENNNSWMIIALVIIVGVVLILIFFICLMICLYLEEDTELKAANDTHALSINAMQLDSKKDLKKD